MAMTEQRLILVNHLMEPPGRVTGITRFLFSLLSELVSRPHFRYALVTTWQADELPLPLRRPELTVISRPYRRSTPVNIVTQMIVMQRLMRETNAVMEFNCNPLGGFDPRWLRVVTVHDLYFDVMGAHYQLHHRLWWKIFLPLVLAASTRVVCVSEATRRDLATYHRRFANKAAVIHEAGALIDSAAGDGITCSGIPYAIYVGNISPNKNPAALVAAMKILEARGTPIRVVHVGRDELSLLSNAAVEAGLAARIDAAGNLSDAELAAAYRGAHCLVVTSTYEGFCLPVIEAQAIGVPVICSDIPVLREVAGEGALFFSPHDADALAESIQAVMSNLALREKLSDAARRNAARFSWSRAAAEAESLFEQLIERRKKN